jgi:hypothetical protein
MGTITGKSGGLNAKVRGTVQAKTVSGTKNAPTKKKLADKKTFGPIHATPKGSAGTGKTPGRSTCAATAGTAARPKGGAGGSGRGGKMKG